jgi:hypothetical protein
VAGNDRQLRIGQLTIDNVKVRAADATGGDLDTNLTRTGMAVRNLHPFKGFPELI